MAQRLEAEGSKNGKSEGSKNGPHKWDDESDHDDVTKIYVRYSPKGIQSIRFDYVKSGIPSDGSLHGQSYHVNTQTFKINHLKNEHLESVEGYYTETGGIQALLFKTNLRISEQMGYPEGIKFTLAVAGKKIIGFHGSTDLSNILSLGAYFTWITSIKMEAKGGKGGREWDDGVDKAGFTKIHVRAGREGVQYIKFEYVDKDGNLKYGPIRGSTYGRGSPHVFEIKHVENEYLVSVEGYYDDASGVIQALQFKTNIKTSQLMGSQKGFKKFRLAADGMKIIGFYGFAEKNLNSLGPYFITLSATKLGCQGILDGKDVWDDGSFKGVRKVCVFCHCSNYITCLRINYDNDGKVEKRDHGVKDGHTGQEGEFVVDYPNEFITSVVGTFTPKNDRRVTSLTFKTSEKRTSKIFGDGSSSDSVEFVLKKKGCAIVGFHGWFNGFSLVALGAYFYPMPPRPTAEKLEAQGGDRGAPWDDGANFESVRKIYIGIGEIGISSVKFMYENDTNEMVVGDHHGNKTLLRHEEFELDYPSEYLTSVEGSYDVVPGSDEFEVILMLKFKTNMRTSPRYGLDDDPSFVLRKEGHKIVGFHGKSNNMLHQIGVHVLPITNYKK